MADQDPITPNDGGGQDGAPQIGVLNQYVKDMSVECPNSPNVFQWGQPQVDVQFNIGVEKVADEVQEVSLKVNVAARSDNGVHFLVDLNYAGLFGLRNVPEDAVGPFLLIEAPRLLFPFARQIISDAVQQTGFPALLLDPIDFGAAFMQRFDEARGGEEAPGIAGGTDEPATDAPSTDSGPQG